jgi:hypothetical protein
MHFNLGNLDLLRKGDVYICIYTSVSTAPPFPDLSDVVAIDCLPPKFQSEIEHPKITFTHSTALRERRAKSDP